MASKCDIAMALSTGNLTRKDIWLGIGGFATVALSKMLQDGEIEQLQGKAPRKLKLTPLGHKRYINTK